MIVQVYGQFSERNSNAIVSRGIANGLASHGFDVQVFGIDVQAGEVDGLDSRVSVGLSPRSAIGIYVGYPNKATMHLNGHGVQVGAFIAESSVLPGEWGAAAASCDIVATPSRWCAEAFVRAGVSPKKLTVMPHGLDPVYQRRTDLLAPELREKGCLRLLHVAGAPSFRDRKGTRKLITAVGVLLKQGVDLSLTLRVGSFDPALASASRGFEDHIYWNQDGPLEPQTMSDYYASGFDALILPSRAEAFGMCAVEARAIGLPVILSFCSGHRQHKEKWDTLIHTHADSPICVNGIPNGMAPSLQSSDIVDAIKCFMRRRVQKHYEAQKNAIGYAGKYTWHHVTRHLANHLQNKTKNEHRLGIGI